MIANNSILTSIQQSVMNFGILMIQGLVNSFGVAVMAAFAAVVKIESFAYLPKQELGNAFSTFIAQNYGAKEIGRIQKRDSFNLKNYYYLWCNSFGVNCFVCQAFDDYFCQR